MSETHKTLPQAPADRKALMAELYHFEVSNVGPRVGQGRRIVVCMPGELERVRI